MRTPCFGSLPPEPQLPHLWVRLPDTLCVFFFSSFVGGSETQPTALYTPHNTICLHYQGISSVVKCMVKSAVPPELT